MVEQNTPGAQSKGILSSLEVSGKDSQGKWILNWDLIDK